MKIATLIPLLFPLLASAQFAADGVFDKNAGVHIANPTNFVGAMGWWVADNISGGNTNANGKVLTWPDYSINAWPLTNLGAASTCPTFSNSWAPINSHAMVHFDKTLSQYLQTVIYTNNQPQEIVMVLNYHDKVSGAVEIFDAGSAGSSHRQSTIAGNSANNLNVYAGTIVASATMTTNKWFVLDCLFNGASSGWFSNNISASATANAGANTMQGITIGIGYNQTGPAPIDVAEICTYSNLLGSVDTAGTFSVANARTLLYGYLTNKYGIAQ